jgi:organic hydroperoxide reductase OsmC/OhrA
MKISVELENSLHRHVVTVRTDDQAHELSIASRPTGYGSAVNGGELLLAALATCFCNDIYREAQKQNIAVDRVTVEVSGEFGGPGEPGYNIVYSAWVEGDAPDEQLAELVRHTDRVAEVQNTLRRGVDVRLMV